jgi:hypothetical protein
MPEPMVRRLESPDLSVDKRRQTGGSSSRPYSPRIHKSGQLHRMPHNSRVGFVPVACPTWRQDRGDPQSLTGKQTRLQTCIIAGQRSRVQSLPSE